MESYEKSDNLSTIQYDFCNCIKSHYYNSYIFNMNNKTIHLNEENKDKRINLPNFFDQKNKMNINKSLSTNQFTNFYDKFFIKNLSLNWMALYNPQNISYNSINRDGCIFTISFNQSGSILASSNHLHNIEIWDMKDRKVKKVIKDHEEIVTGIEFFNAPSNQNLNSSEKNLKKIEDFSLGEEEEEIKSEDSYSELMEENIWEGNFFIEKNLFFIKFFYF